MEKQYSLFIGRFQPFHLGHQWLFSQKLDKGHPVLIAIRDVVPDEKNPLTAQQSKNLIEKVYENQDVKVIIIPDISSVNWGRGVGYTLEEHYPPSDIENISATQIRKQLSQNDNTWKKLVNPIIWDDIENLLK